MKTILSLITVLSLSLSACIADPADDVGNSRDLDVDDTHGHIYESVDQDDLAPSVTDDTRADDTHGHIYESVDQDDLAPSVTDDTRANPDDADDNDDVMAPRPLTNAR